MTPPPIRVLVVDDSAFARKVLRQVLTGAPGITVVDTARDGLDALEKISQLQPDVVTLDLVMPHLDGLGVLRSLAGAPSPRVVVVSSAGEESELAVSALQAGAVDLVHKPTALATDRLYELGAELVTKVTTAARATVRPGVEAELITKPALGPAPAPWRRLVVVGTSTGGPAALSRLLSSLPGDFPAALALALHIPAGYTEALARRLDGQSSLEVVEAEDGMELRPGRAVLARAGMHLKLEREGERSWTRLDRLPASTPHHPSVDVLFESAAAGWGENAVGVVLTGMGDDGLQGSRAIRAARGRVLTESAESCVVYGMPRVVDEAGLSNRSAALSELPALLERFVR
ncbi:MAG TPA: chemotaxis-specific protein-glutamate methyltransferase CheB [Myxococcaceae bacterium]|jgi:two-component system chemotaxis response regulator CheB